MGSETADGVAVGRVALATALETTINGDLAIRSLHRTKQRDARDQSVRSSKTSAQWPLTPNDIKSILNRVPLETLHADEDVHSPTMELTVFDDHGLAVDIVLALLDSGNERRLISESRARKQGWMPSKKEGQQAISMSLYDMSGRRITSLGIHKFAALAYTADGPEWLNLELQVVPDDQLGEHVESVILDAASISRNNLWPPNPVMHVAA